MPTGSSRFSSRFSINRRTAFLAILAAVIVLATMTVVVLRSRAPRKMAWPEPDHASVLTITVGLAHEPDILFPLGAYMPEARLILAAVYEPPVHANQYVYQPSALQTLPTLENGLAQLLGRPPQGEIGVDTRQISATFGLRQDLRWADGQPVTADDLAFAYQLARNPDVDIAYPKQADEIADVQGSGEYSVSLQLHAGVINPLYFTYVYPPLPRHQLSEQDPAGLAFGEYSRRPMGYGPYTVSEWTPDERIVLQRNNYYYRRASGVPRVPYLIFKFMADPQARLKAVEDGQIDVAVGLMLEDVPDVLEAKEAGRVQAQFAPGQTWELIAFNLDDPILGDPAVRQAIAFGTDRQRMVDELLYGKVKVMHAWLPPDHPYYAGDDALSLYPYDPQRAGQMLDAAGWEMGADGVRAKGGQRLELTLRGVTEIMSLRSGYLAIFQENMAAIGLDVEIEPLSPAAWYGHGGKLVLRDFQLGAFPWVAAPEPGGAELWTATSIPSTTNGYRGQNYFGWRNEENDALYKQLGQTLESAERRALYAQQQALFTQDLPALPLFQRLVVVAINPKMTGVRLDPTGLLTWNVHEWDIPRDQGEED
jgi:peptide/nickel transport system substrate-binding protein